MEFFLYGMWYGTQKRGREGMAVRDIVREVERLAGRERGMISVNINCSNFSQKIQSSAVGDKCHFTNQNNFLLKSHFFNLFGTLVFFIQNMCTQFRSGVFCS